ncbi:MAG: hypothetical protein VX460_13505 [Planctomycetota bacterium]|nr:hypothetical protein [Planctomycetota bacterium]
MTDRDELEDEDELLEDEWPDEDWEDEGEEEEPLEEEDLGPADPKRSLRFALFAMAPLLVIYELALSLGDGVHRAVSESLLMLPFAAIAGGDAALARRVVVGLALAVALYDSWRHVEAAGRRAVRVAVEGALAALLLIPLLDLVARRVPVAAPHGVDLGLAEAGAARGGAADDVLLVRVLLLSVAFVGLRKLLGAAGVRGRLASLLGAGGAALVAAGAQAATPLEPVAAFVREAGESFDASVFAWRVVAGLYLAALVLMRGVGVAAWAHALHHLVTLLRP